MDIVSLPLGALPCCCVSERRKPQGLGRLSRGQSPQSCAVGTGCPGDGDSRHCTRSLPGPLTPQTVEESLSRCLAGSSHSFARLGGRKDGVASGTAGQGGPSEGKGRSPSAGSGLWPGGILPSRGAGSGPTAVRLHFHVETGPKLLFP